MEFLSPERVKVGVVFRKVICVHIPVTSEDMIFDTSEKCLQLMAARLAPSGSMSVIWLHRRLTYFLNREPAPWSSESEMVISEN